MIERRLRARLESAAGSILAVVTVGTAAEPAALAVGALALALASEGRNVVVVDAADNRILASVLGLAASPDTMETFQIPVEEGPPMRVIVAPEDPAQVAQKPPPDDADVVLVLTSLDPAFGTEQLASWVTDAVLVLSAAASTSPVCGSVARSSVKRGSPSARSSCWAQMRRMTVPALSVRSIAG